MLQYSINCISFYRFPVKSQSHVLSSIIVSKRTFRNSGILRVYQPGSLFEGLVETNKNLQPENKMTDNIDIIEQLQESKTIRKKKG